MTALDADGSTDLLGGSTTSWADASSSTTPHLTIVVPTRNEADLVRPLVDRIHATCTTRRLSYECVFVDDSDDETPQILSAIANEGLPVRVIHRPAGARAGGLSTAVVEGFRVAAGAVVVVCDGDLQHPPEAIPTLVAAVSDGTADIAVGTRYAHGGSSVGLAGAGRRIASRATALVARTVLPASRGLTDPAGGFFAVRTELVRTERLTPKGFKILLEVLARCPWTTVVEVPYRFDQRGGGSSSFGGVQLLGFGRHLTRLALSSGGPASPSRALSEPTGTAWLRSAGRRSSSDPTVWGRLVGRLRRAPVSFWVLVGLFAAFAAVELVVIVHPLNGPFLDEGIYVTSGLRTLQGHGIADGYLGWFAGSLLWPVVAGLSYGGAGLAGARLAAAVLVVVGCAGSVAAARRLYGVRAAAFATVLLLGSAPTLALAHLAVYDVVAAGALGVCMGAVAEYRHSGRRAWLVAASLLFGVATLGKYPAGFMLPWVLGFVISRRRRTAVADVITFVGLYAAVLVSYFLSFRYQLAYFLRWRISNNPSFGVTLRMVSFEQVLYGLPWVVIVGLGVVVSKGAQRRLALTLGSAVLLFPAYHIATVNSVSADKHVVFGFLIAAPVAGLALSRLARRQAIVPMVATALGVLTLFDVHLMTVMNRGWPDESGVSRYLAAQLRPTETVLAPDGWQLLPPMEGRGISAPSKQMTDIYGFIHASPPLDPCSFDWVVVNQNWDPLPARVLPRLESCGFTPVFASHSSIIDLGRTLRYVSWTADFVVYQRPGA